jgi:hypothetical protein
MNDLCGETVSGRREMRFIGKIVGFAFEVGVDIHE